MLHKVERLVSIGKFRNFQASGDICFKPFTLIYADNGIGKTTLTAVLRSLTEGKPEIVQKRISTNNQNPQAAQIVHRNGSDTHCTLRTSGWSNPFPDIEIFDIHFVTDNIYSGFEFNSEHGQNLHQFVIGAQGVAIKLQIEQNKAAKTASRVLQEQLSVRLYSDVANGLDGQELNAFLSLVPSDAVNIDTKISTAQAALSSAQSNTTIQTLQSLSSLNRITSGINFTTLISDLQTTTQTIQDRAMQALFENHCQDLTANTVQSPEGWLRIGHNYIVSKKRQSEEAGASTAELHCPFCKQTVDDEIDILKSYTLKFNDEFNTFIDRLQNHLASLQSFNLDVTIQALKNTDQQNAGKITSWQTHLPAGTVSPAFNIIQDEVAIKTELQSVISSVQQKIQNPSLAVPTTTAETFQSSLQTADAGIVIYNQSVTVYNSAITTFRASIQTEAQAQAELNRLNRIKKRFEPAIDPICTQLVAERTTLRGLETAYPILVGQQETAANAFFTLYKGKVNEYLRDIFKTPFLIDEVAHIPPQGRGTQSRMGYNLLINGQPISFDNSKPTSIKDCLSEGDKSTLAFAFFLSKLYIDTGKQNKIVVLDDPLSSFDSNRRFKTVKEISKLVKEVKQVIVLSHDGKFLYDLNKKIRSVEKKALKLSFVDANDTSIIEFLDIEKALQNDYFTCLDKIKDFIANGTDTGKREIRREIRVALEYYLIFKYYTKINDNTITTFGKLVEKLAQLISTRDITFRDSNSQQVIDDLNELNEISWDSHHGDSDVFETVTEIPIEQISLTELKDFLRTTINLIENRI